MRQLLQEILRLRGSRNLLARQHHLWRLHHLECLAIRPNITGVLYSRFTQTDSRVNWADGVFTTKTVQSDSSQERLQTAISGNSLVHIEMSAKSANSLYAGETLQTSALQVLPCIRI